MHAYIVHIHIQTDRQFYRRTIGRQAGRQASSHRHIPERRQVLQRQRRGRRRGGARQRVVDQVSLPEEGDREGETRHVGAHLGFVVVVVLVGVLLLGSCRGVVSIVSLRLASQSRATTSPVM